MTSLAGLPSSPDPDSDPLAQPDAPGGIVGAAPADGDDDIEIPSTDYYRVLALPINGSTYAQKGIGVAIELANSPDVIRRVYKGAPVSEIAEEIHLVLNPDAKPPEESASVVPPVISPASGALSTT